MLEVALVVIIAGSLLMATRRLQSNQRLLPHPDGTQQSLSTLAHGGLYSVSLPAESPSLTAFRDLHLVTGGLMFTDAQANEAHVVYFTQIQWASAVTLPQAGIASITLHLEAGQRWRVLTLQLAESDMGLLVKVLRQAVTPSRRNFGRRPTPPIGPIVARVAEDTLQGRISLGAEISLYLLPHLLIVLQGDQVVAKLDMSSIRRVLAVERVSGRLDSLLSRHVPDGIIRLYSMYETAAFALPQFRELAEEIAYSSRAPLEFITQHDKTGKV